MKRCLQVFKEMRIVYKKSKNLDILQKYKQENIDINWIGEPYFSFEIPSEFLESDVTLNSFVYKRLQDTYHVFQNADIAQYVYPVTYIDRKNNICLIHMIINKKPLKRFLVKFISIAILSLMIYLGYIIYK